MVKQHRTLPGNILKVPIFLMLLSSPSCQTPQYLMVHQSDEALVVLRKMPVGYPVLPSLQHPYGIQPQEVFDILASLNYDTGSFLPLARSHPRSLLTKPQAELLSAELSKALTLSTPEQVSAFMITDPEKPDRRTRGLAFVLDDEFHMIIEELHRPRYEGEQPTYQQPVSRWRLLTSGKQRHYARHPGGKGVMTNWLITPLR
jgi:hypothetical protein